MNKPHELSKCVSEKFDYIHISLLNFHQSLKSPNLKLGLKLKIIPFKVGLFRFFFLFSLQLSNAPWHVSPEWGDGGFQ